MSKSIEPVINAFLTGKSKKISNTETNGSELWLFGNKIAKKGVDGIFISDGGYAHTSTTQDRLNMLGAKISLKKRQFYKDGVKWNGSWINIKDAPIIKKEEKTSLFE